MSTVSIKEAEAVRDGKGYYPGDEHLPPVIAIVKYNNQFNGSEAYKLYYRGQLVTASPAMHNAELWWIKPDETIHYVRMSGITSKGLPPPGNLIDVPERPSGR